MRRDTFLEVPGRAGRRGRPAPVGPRRRQRQDDDPGQPRRRLGHHRPCAGQGHDATPRSADTVTYDNKGGAAGALGLAQFVNGSKGDPNALMVMGAVMLGGIITGKPPVKLSRPRRSRA